MKKIVTIFLCTLVLYSCNRNNGTNSITRYSAWVPIYAKLTEIGIVSYTTPIATQTAGKIYLYNNYIFQNEQYKGFHIIDNTNPANPVKIGFLSVPFSTEISIKNNYLYTNSVSDLVVINIANITTPVISKRIANAFPLINQEYPPVTGTYFECVDANKGIVVRWELKQNVIANCKR